jgi:hypothetical protein
MLRRSWLPVTRSQTVKAADSSSRVWISTRPWRRQSRAQRSCCCEPSPVPVPVGRNRRLGHIEDPRQSRRCGYSPAGEVSCGTNGSGGGSRRRHRQRGGYIARPYKRERQVRGKLARPVERGGRSLLRAPPAAPPCMSITLFACLRLRLIRVAGETIGAAGGSSSSPHPNEKSEGGYGYCSRFRTRRRWQNNWTWSVGRDESCTVRSVTYGIRPGVVARVFLCVSFTSILEKPEMLQHHAVKCSSSLVTIIVEGADMHGFAAIEDAAGKCW